LNLEEQQKEKKARKKRAIKLVDGVGGSEISLYINDLKRADIKITFLQLGNFIYKDVIKIYFHEELLKNFDILNYCNLLNYELLLKKPKKVNEIFQSVQTIFTNSQIKNFEIRQLFRNPYFEVTIGSRNYIKYSETIKREFFQRPLYDVAKLKGE